jgi:gentisate 1,2-dioxygenase
VDQQPSGLTNYHVVGGSGYSLVGGRRLDWEDKDVFTVPT